MVRANVARVLVVVALVASAGCGQSGPTTPTADGNGGEMTEVAPGIGERAGLTNVSALMTEHRRSLRESGFTYRFVNERVERVTSPDGPNSETVETAVTGRVAAEPGLAPYLVNETDTSENPTTITTRYVGPDGGGERLLRGDNATVASYDEEATVLLTTHYLLHDFLSEADWTIVNRTDGTVVLEAGPGWSEWRNETGGDVDVGEQTYFEGQLRVSTDGRVEQMTVNRTTVEVVRRNGTVQSRGTTVRNFEFELLRTGDTQVDRPAWVSAGGNATTAGGASGGADTADGTTATGGATASEAPRTSE